MCDSFDKICLNHVNIQEYANTKYWTACMSCV